MLSGVIVRWLCVRADRLQSINYGIEDGTLSDIEEATKSKFYEYDTDWESSRDGLVLLYYQFIFRARELIATKKINVVKNSNAVL